MWVHPRCLQFRKECGAWKWKTDKTGKPLNVPEDKNDHGINAVQYGNVDLWYQMATKIRVREIKSDM